MVISHNMLAMNANRMLNLNTTAKSKSTEKLSSGYKVNRAADDAAGLAISEKMRRQIRGLTQGAYNIQDGISLLQIADGAMSEVHDILHRITELSTKSANGTNDDVDRQYIQTEISQLLEEIDEIGNITDFNSMKVFSPNSTFISKESAWDFILFNGISINGYLSEMPDEEFTYPAVAPGFTSNSRLMDVYVQIEDNNTFGIYEQKSNSCIFQANFSPIADVFHHDDKDKIHGGDVLLFGQHSGNYTCGDYTYIPISNNSVVQASLGFNLKYLDYYQSIDKDTFNSMLKNNMTITITLNPYASGLIDITGGFASYNNSNDVDDIDNSQNKSWWIQTGPEENEGLFIHTGSLDCKSLGLFNLNVLTEESSRNTIDIVKKAGELLSFQRAQVGADTNRLEHSFRINSNVVENTTAAESQIRDTDMATEMVKFSNHNVLEQIGQSMLAQANQFNQAVLALL